MNKSKIKDFYDNLQETIVDDIENDDKIETLWNEINEIDELLKNTISKEDYQIFDEYLSK